MLHLLVTPVAIALVFLSSIVCLAKERDLYVDDEKSGLDVPTEFKLKYQVPSEWLLQEDESDLFGARSSWRGNMAMEGNYFFNDGLYQSQSQTSADLSFEPEYSLTWPAGHFFVLTPFLQIDSQDDERTHADLREMYGMYVSDWFELAAGARKVFWGVTESQNLVDIINQRDLLASKDGNDKLGQPMVNLTVLKNWGTLDLFVMPYFRELAFPGEDGRLRSPLPIDTGRAQYESSAEEWHTDFALRYSHYFGELEFGLSLFNGTTRDPEIRGTDFVQGVPTTLFPYYYQTTQAGLDLQYILGALLLKGEIVYRQQDIDSIDDYTAWTTGFEYILNGIAGTESDLSIMAEWLYDERDSELVVFANDIMLGLRLAINDTSSSEVTMSLIQDLEYSSMAMGFEASRRLTDHWKLNVDARWWFEDDEVQDLFYILRDDDYVSISLAYYF